MDSYTYDVATELVTFPDMAPPPLRGECWVLGKKYCLPHGEPATSLTPGSCGRGEAVYCPPLPDAGSEAKAPGPAP